MSCACKSPSVLKAGGITVYAGTCATTDRRDLLCYLKADHLISRKEQLVNHPAKQKQMLQGTYRDRRALDAATNSPVS
jgi:hypothetical protein